MKIQKEDDNLPTDVTINGTNYRLDLIVLERLDAKGNPTEKYWELDYGKFEELVEQEQNSIQGDLVTLILKKTESHHNQLVERLQLNNQRLAALIEQTENVLDPQYLESVSGN